MLAHVPDPKKLKKAGIKAFFVGGSGQGSAYAVYHAPNDPGVWKGVAALPLDSTSGWHRVNVSKVEFAWRYYSGNTQNGQDSAMTLQDLAARHGGNGRGAEIGVLFGCTGETFYLDDLEVSSRKVDRTYDLGGYRTVSDIVWGSAIRKKITITFGQRLGLTGRLREKYDYSTMSGALNIQRSRPERSGASTTVSPPAVGSRCRRPATRRTAPSSPATRSTARASPGRCRCW